VTRDNGSREYELGVLNEILVFRLRRIRDVLTHSFRKSSTEGRGLRAGEFSILALIEANPDISQVELATIGGFDQTILVGVIDDLEERKWVVRQQHKEDRRRRVLQITKQGRAALADLLAKALKNEQAARDALTAAEMAAFQQSLDKIFRSLLRQ
jgi:DNA-binding MarR family transcriptional regulator